MLRKRVIQNQICYYHSLSPNPENEHFLNHMHEDCELYIFVSGQAVYHVEGAVYKMEPGDVLIMRPEEGHYVEPQPGIPYERIAINFPLSLFREFDVDSRISKPFLERKSGTKNHYSGSAFRHPLKESYLDRIEEENGEIFLPSAILGILSEIALAFERVPNPEHWEATEQKLLRYIDTHLCEELNIQTLSDRFHFSPSTLSRRFKKATGTTIAQYLNQKRLIRAHKLLKEGMRPTTVAQEIGFTDYSAFFRAYKKRYGVAPKETESRT